MSGANQIRVGIFFDGTGNNAFNDIRDEATNATTNVYRIFKQYQSQTTGAVQTHKLYVTGVGTPLGTASQENDVTPTVIGTVAEKLLVVGGGTGLGIQDRINQAFRFIEQLQQDNPGVEIKIDLTGFSRDKRGQHTYFSAPLGPKRVHDPLFAAQKRSCPHFCHHVHPRFCPVSFRSGMRRWDWRGFKSPQPLARTRLQP